MNVIKNKIQNWILVIVMSVVGASVDAAIVGDIVRVKNMQASEIIGVGLVVGLNGTGDGGKYAPSVRALRNIIVGLLDDRDVTSAELKAAKNVALVALTAKIPAAGVVEGDKVDVQVASIGGAKSLKGGRLFTIPLTAPFRRGQVIGFAQGPITSEDKDNLNTGVVKKGATITTDVVADFKSLDGKITLVLNNQYANLKIANDIAMEINDIKDVDDTGDKVAKAIDAKQIVLTLKSSEQNNIPNFLAEILGTYIDTKFLITGSKVVINRKTGTIVIGGDVEISPVVIMQRGLTINVITPKPDPTPENPQLEIKDVVKIDPQNQGGIKMQALADAMKELKVPIEDRIAILTEIHRAGKLHASLEFED